MDARLPVFPLETVLFPGLVLPLHIFEPRYLTLIRHLANLPEGTPREFGVVLIRGGGPAPSVAGPSVGGPAVGGPGAGGPGAGGPGAGGPGAGGPGAGAGGPDAAGPVGSGPVGSGPVGSGPVGGIPVDPPAAEPGGQTSLVALHDIGCTAELRQVTELPDGRLDVVTVGRRRFRIKDVGQESTPYLTADVDWLPEPTGQEQIADQLAPRVLAVFRQYLTLVRDDPEEIAEQLPDDPTVLSHLVAATAALTLNDRQQLLATPDTAGRLRAELRLLNREAALLRQVRAVPVPLAELAVPLSPN